MLPSGSKLEKKMFPIIGTMLSRDDAPPLPPPRGLSPLPLSVQVTSVPLILLVDKYRNQMTDSNHRRGETR